MPGLANWVDTPRSGGRAGLDGEIMDSTLVMYSLSCYSQAKGSFPTGRDNISNAQEVGLGERCVWELLLMSTHWNRGCGWDHQWGNVGWKRKRGPRLEVRAPAFKTHAEKKEAAAEKPETTAREKGDKTELFFCFLSFFLTGEGPSGTLHLVIWEEESLWLYPDSNAVGGRWHVEVGGGD